MADKKPTNREKLNEITASIERGIKELLPWWTALKLERLKSSNHKALTLCDDGGGKFEFCILKWFTQTGEALRQLFDGGLQK